VKRNTEKFARDRGIQVINAEVLYAAKESVGA
jgi:light-independent protochlorophyllide reductase subunit B